MQSGNNLASYEDLCTEPVQPGKRLRKPFNGLGSDKYASAIPSQLSFPKQEVSASSRTQTNAAASSALGSHFRTN
ncbi:hypothetical protein [Chitinophaga skermanii]|uniref:hypothetical protein n=1 Tax=Chitinophaga skermanii TaxID=331697 RepID=UPI000DB9A467|nr:hypothetical protein [Chitinophaga skermanii]